MPNTVLSPTEISKQIGPILTQAWQQARSLTGEEIAQIKAVVQNLEAEVRAELNSGRPKGEWVIARGRDAEKITSVTIYFRPWETKAGTANPPAHPPVSKARSEVAHALEPVVSVAEVVPENAASIPQMTPLLQQQDTPLRSELPSPQGQLSLWQL